MIMDPKKIKETYFNNTGGWVAAPLVALILSYFFESYEWPILSIIGSIFLIIGNILILKKW